jgi:type II secretory pathway predicted ATPase ExeA
MYLSHFGLDEPPFRITPNTEFFFEGANRGATLDALLYAITHDEGIVKVSGEVGSGKTMLCRVLINRLPTNVETIYLSNPSLSREEILHAIAEDLHLTLKGRRTALLLRALQEHLIQRYAEGRRVVVLIDEAHAMPAESLEEIRLLSNLESNRHKLLQIVLFGQPELDDHLNLPNMRQLKERITHSFRLEPLIRSDIESYIEFRMRAAGYRGQGGFSKAALRLIASASQGLTRRVNILADKALLSAFADNAQQVQVRHARAAVKDSGFRRIQRAFNPWWLAATGLAAGLALGIAAQLFPVRDWLPEGLQPASAAKGPEVPPASRDSVPAAPQGAQVKSLGASTAAESAPHAAAAHATEGSPRTAAPNAPTVPLGDSRPEPGAAERREPSAALSPLQTVDVPSTPAPIDPDEGLIQSELIRERHAATQRWLQQTPADRYSIQLLTATESEVVWMENFLRRAVELVSADQLYVYSWKVNGRLNYRVSYGTYDSAQQSVVAIAQLPAPLRAYRPYPETVAAIRQISARR